MQIIGRTPPFSAVTSMRSIRCGFSRGSAALATIGQLIDVGDQHLLPPADRPADAAVAGLDPLDDPFLGIAVFDGPKHHAVAGGHHVALIGGQRFQQPPRGTLIEAAALIFDDADQPEHTRAPGRVGRHASSTSR